MILLSFCDMPWWLPWLLPFLLGLALGWALWAKYKSMVADLEGRINGLNSKVSHLEGELNTYRHKLSDCESDVSLAKGKMREVENEMAELQIAHQKALAAKAATTGSATVSSQSSFAASTPKAEEVVTKVSDVSTSSTGSTTISGGVDTTSSFAASSGTVDKYAALKSDNLQVIEGIGPKMDEVLKSNGVHTWAELASMDSNEVRAILDKYGDQYKIIDPATWPQQAALANKGDWNGLIHMQKYLDTGVESATASDSKAEKIMIKLGIIKQWKQDDLKAVEGIGPKIEDLLHAAGIKTWNALSNANVDHLKNILEGGGPRFALADPTTWPRQAELADKGNFDELAAYQDTLKGGKG